MNRSLKLRWILPVIGALFLAGCSDPATESLAADVSSPTTAVESSATVDDPTTTTAAPTTASDEASDSEPDSDSESDSEQPAAPPPPPLEPNVGPSSVIEETTRPAWISRRFMTATEIELSWSAQEGADAYEIHRIESESESPPSAEELTTTTLINSARDEAGVFLDDGVTPDTRYWYGIRSVDEAGAQLSIGWHRAAAVTDEEPPAPVELDFELTNGAVELSWNQPDENFELHAFRVLRSVGDEEPQLVVTTWNIDQTTFVDIDPPTGTVSYFVQAVDFHWNESDRTEVAVAIS